MKASAGNRVLMLLENSRYPQDPRVRREALTLAEAGVDVTVISPGVSTQPRFEVLEGVSVYRFPVPRRGSGMLGYIWEFGYCTVATFFLSLWVFFRRGFDVIHAHNPPDLFVLIACFYKLFGKKFVFDHHDLAPEMYFARFGGKGNPIAYRLLIWFEKLSCRVADQVIATNESYKAMEMCRGKVDEDRITVVRNGPNLSRVRRVAADVQLRQKAPFIIGYIGEMGCQDGIDYLLRALRKLIDDFGRRDFYAVLIGRGEQFETLNALKTELELDEFVHFAGYVPEADVMSYLSSADIFVDPDPSNSFTDRSTMIKMMEYMALSRPIVAFDLPEHRVTAENAALYAKANDEYDFAKHIVLLMEDAQLREEMGEFGRNRIETRLAWSHQKAHLLSVYKKLDLPVLRPKPIVSPVVDSVKRADRVSI